VVSETSGDTSLTVSEVSVDTSLAVSELSLVTSSVLLEELFDVVKSFELQEHTMPANKTNERNKAITFENLRIKFTPVLFIICLFCYKNARPFCGSTNRI
jgi:hypothetical protein